MSRKARHRLRRKDVIFHRSFRQREWRVINWLTWHTSGRHNSWLVSRLSRYALRFLHWLGRV